MRNISIEIPFKEVERLILGLDGQTQQRLMDALMKSRVRSIASKFQRNVRRQGLTQKQIHQIVEKARQAYHERSRS